MVCATQIPDATIMPQHVDWAAPHHAPSWNADDWSEKAGPAAAAAALAKEARCQSNAPTAVQKDLMKIQKKLREMAKIEKMVATGAKVDTLQWRKLEQKEALITERDQVKRAVEEEQNRMATERRRQQHEQQHYKQQREQQHEQQRVQLHDPQLRQIQLLQSEQHQQQQEHQPQLIQQVTAAITQSPNLAQGCWRIPVTQVQLMGVVAPICDQQQQVQEVQLVQACPMPVEHLAALQEHLQVSLQVWPFRQLQQEQEQQQLQQQQWQFQAGAIQYGFHQQPAMEVRPDVPKELHEEAASSVSSSSSPMDILMESLSGDDEAKKVALGSFRGSVVHRTFTAQGSRAVQLAFQVAETKVATELLSELKGHVEAATRSPHANYVIQKAIEVMPPAACGFIVQEMRGVGAAVARHRFGCRILCRLLEHMAASPACVELFAEVLAEARQLCCDQFGHYVMQSVLEHGQPQQRGCIVQLIVEGPSLAKDPFASYVVNTAITHGSAEEQQRIGAALQKYGMVTLASTLYGSFVAKTLVKSGVDAALAATKELCHAEAQLQESRFGKRVFQEASRHAVRVA